MYNIILLLFLFTLVCGQDTRQGYDCIQEGVKGKCMDIRVCPSALKDLKLKIKPQICSFNGNSTIPNVCCLSPIVNKPSPISTKSDKAECPPIKNYIRGSNNQDKQITQGHKAWAKCLEYQMKAVFPCLQVSTALSLDGTPYYDRFDRCYMHNRKPPPLIVSGGGIDAEEGEFPHMALLGYGNDIDSAKWFCGGSLISEKYILTAAHCISTTELGTVAFAALGVWMRTDPRDKWNVYRIKTITKHPAYKSPSKYNDIALLETEGEVKFSSYVIPACLHVGDEVPDTRTSAIGWGALGYYRELADTLQDVPLWKVDDANCSARYPPHRHLLAGYNSTTQVCYGDDGRERDTCSGDSGGPLEMLSQDIYCMHLIIGVTSFGHRTCGEVGYPGMYTRVSHYVPWIESIVWP